MFPRKEYLATRATPETKRNLLLVTILCLVSVALIVASVIGTLTMSMLEIPFVSVALEASGQDTEEMMESLEESYEEAEEALENDTAMDSDEREAAEKTLESMEKVVNNFSIMNFMSFANVVEEVGEDYVGEDTMEDLQSVSSSMSVVVGVIVAAFILPMLFTLLGGLLKKKGLVIAALTFTVFSQALLCGFVWVILSLVLYIAQFVLCSKADREYKDYCAGKLPA